MPLTSHWETLPMLTRPPGRAKSEVPDSKNHVVCISCSKPAGPEHPRPAPQRTVLVEDFLGGQQTPKTLYELPEGHIHLHLKTNFQNNGPIICYRYIGATCEYFSP